MILMSPLARFHPPRESLIDNIDPSAFPALRGYWKCNDGGGTVRDSSMYGNHLALEISGSGFTAESVWSNKPGWLSIKSHDRARIALTDSLNTGAKFVVVSCDFEHENVLSDCDLGTAWNSDGIATGEYRGFSIAPIGDIIAFRVAEYAPGATGDWSASGGNLNMSNAVTTGNPLGVPIGVSGAFRPADSVSLCIDGGTLTTSATAIATLESQADTFALGAAKLPVTGNGYTAIRNYQIWAFDSEPPRLDYTLRYMAKNPGLIPWWWEGL